MFEVGFSELCMVGLVALLVIGPEKLPKIARLAGFWLGKTRSMVASVKAEIKDELRAEEMRQLLNQQHSDIGEFQDMLKEAANAAESMQTTVTQSLADPIIKDSQPNEPK
jgi:sec-independent protein translocase protein TatB